MEAIDYSKISITAKLVAYYRQFSDIPFAQDVAGYVKAEEAVQEIASKLLGEDGSASQRQEMGDRGKILAPFFEARYKSIVQVILRTGMKQVLELASGFSLRGLAMTKSTDISYVESDLAGINDEKTKVVGALKTKYGIGESGNHHVATANAFERSDLEAAVAALKHDQPLAVVNEGLIAYLSADEMAVLAGNIRYLLSRFAGGVWITPDFTTRQLADDMAGHTKLLRKALNATTGRPFQEAAFDSEASITEFIGEHGFTGTSTYQTDEVTNLVSPERLGLSSTVVDMLKPRMRIWALSAI